MRKSVKRVLDAFAVGISGIRYPGVEYNDAGYEHDLKECATIKSEENGKEVTISIYLNRVKAQQDGPNPESGPVFPGFAFTATRLLKDYKKAHVEFDARPEGQTVFVSIPLKKRTVNIHLYSNAENDVRGTIDPDGKLHVPPAEANGQTPKKRKKDKARKG